MNVFDECFDCECRKALNDPRRGKVSARDAIRRAQQLIEMNPVAVEHFFSSLEAKRDEQ